MPLVALSQVPNSLKAQASVKAYLLRTLDDPDSYKPVSFSKVAKTYTVFEETRRYTELVNDTDMYHEKNIEIDHAVLNVYSSGIGSEDLKQQLIDGYKKKKAENRFAIDSLKTIMEKERRAFEPVFSGYYVDHEFRAKNKFGGLVLTKWEFNFDEKYKVLSTKPYESMEEIKARLKKQLDSLKREYNSNQ